MRDAIERIELISLRLPFHGQVTLRSSQGNSYAFSVLRLTTRDGAEGLAELAGVARTADYDPHVLRAQLERFVLPVLKGADPFDHAGALAALQRLRGCGPAKAMVDLALWDLRGKLLGQPVWRLLGSGSPKPVPICALVLGEDTREMLRYAEAAVARGMRALKLKIWQCNASDIELVANVRRAVGDDVLLYADANHAYSETQARTLLPKLAEYNLAFLEDPCPAPAERLALLAQALPTAILGDIPIDSLGAAYRYVSLNALGGVAIHPRKTGFSESLKIVGVCEGAGIPVLLGTDLESRLGALARLHLYAATPALQAWPAELNFQEYLNDDVLVEPLAIVDGKLMVPEKPGFGGTLDLEKVQKYRT